MSGADAFHSRSMIQGVDDKGEKNIGHDATTGCSSCRDGFYKRKKKIGTEGIDVNMLSRLFRNEVGCKLQCFNEKSK